MWGNRNAIAPDGITEKRPDGGAGPSIPPGLTINKEEPMFQANYDATAARGATPAAPGEDTELLCL